MAKKTVRFEEARRKRLKEGKLLQRERSKALRAEERLVGTKFKGKERLLKARAKARRKAMISPGKRAKRFRELAKAFGTMPGQASGAGPGRPRKSYKYKIAGRPVSVFVWRKHMAEMKRQRAQFEQQSNQRLTQKGFSQDNIQQLRQLRQRHIVQRVQEGKPEMENNVADQEASFHEHLARTTVTPGTQRILTALRRTQLKGARDDINQQRIHHERQLVRKQGNLMYAHLNMRPVKLDFTGVNSEENILTAPSVFKEDKNDNILRTRGRPSILNTKEAGNSLFF